MCNKTLSLGKLIACCSVTWHKWVSWLRFWATRIYGSRTGFLVLPFWGSDHLAIPPFVMIGHHLYYLNPFEHFETYRFEVLKPRNVPRTSLFSHRLSLKHFSVSLEWTLESVNSRQRFYYKIVWLEWTDPVILQWRCPTSVKWVSHNCQPYLQHINIVKNVSEEKVDFEMALGS